MSNTRHHPVVVLTFLIPLLFITAAARGGNGAIGFDPFSAGPTRETTPLEATAESEGPIIPEIGFENDEISFAFQIISDATGWSIIPTTEVSKAKISVWAKSMSAGKLLDTIVTMAGFTLYRQDRVITVMTYDEYAQFHGLHKEVIFLKYANAEAVSLILNAFLTKMGKCVVHLETNAIVCLDSEANLRTILSLVEKLDVPDNSQVTIEVVDLVYMDAVELAETLQKVFAEQERPNTTSQKFTSAQRASALAGEKITEPVAPLAAGAGVVSPRSRVAVYALGRSNQVILRAFRGDIERLKELIEQLDTFVEPSTKNYHFTYVDASEIFTGLEQILDLPTRTGMSGRSSGRGQSSQGSQNGGRPGGTTLVAKTNSILLTAPPSAHRIMASIVESVDVPATYETGIIQIYRIENADVEEVAQAIRELLQRREDRETKPGESRYREGMPAETSAETPGETPGETLGEPGDMQLSEMEKHIPQVEARVAVSKATNSVIVQATARQHRELEKLLVELDKRRRQVLIESRIVEVTTTEEVSLGVELSQAGSDGFSFTHFGLSSNLDPTSGTRDVIVSPGGSAAVLRPGDLQAILKALQSDRNARVTSAPRILVNDNATGLINSVAEEPYTEINQGQVTDTVSFGGFVEAGTQFLITPHISESGYLRVEYQITLNSFSARPNEAIIPPPRNTSNIRSEATVPDGHTIIVGGLQTSDEKTTVDKVPLLGDIPILGLAFRNTTTSKTYKTTYLFITPMIMEQEDFSDLKDASEQSLQEVKRNDPAGEVRETTIGDLGQRPE